jgi:glycosyltransferase involved in cell wall biosynthesis
MIKVAYGSIPKEGGTFSFFLNHKNALKDFGIDLYCVTVGFQSNLLVNRTFHTEGCVYLARHSFTLKKQVEKFIQWVEDEEIDVIIPVNSEPMNSSVSVLPSKVKVISRVANSFKLGYQIAVDFDEFIDRYVALSSRAYEDLMALGIERERITKIPNGFDTSLITAENIRYSASSVIRVGGFASRLRLGFVGRLEHNQKGVFHLKPILMELENRGIDFSLEIIGSGKDKVKLKNDLAYFIEEGKVMFLGSIKRDELIGYYKNFDILLFTSHFEGMPNVLIESLCSGNFAISWRLPGITDEIIGKDSGALFELGDYMGIAKVISDINIDQLRRNSYLRQQQNCIRFSNIHSAQSYSKLIKQLVNDTEIEGDKKNNKGMLRRPSYYPNDVRSILSSLMTKLKGYFHE